MSDEKQAVVDEAAVAQPTAEPQESAREPSLDELLAQYDNSQQSQVQPQPEYTQPQETAADIRLRAVEQRLFQEDVNKTLANVLREINVPDTPQSRLLAEGFVDRMAYREPKIKTAFDNRVVDPAGWAKFERSLGSEFKKLINSLTIDQTATQDREAVAAAVRGASTRVTADPPPKFGGMSNAEFRKSVKDQFGFDPGV